MPRFLLPNHAETRVELDFFLPPSYFFLARFPVVQQIDQAWDHISPDLTTNDPQKQNQQQSGGVAVDDSFAETHATIFITPPVNPCVDMACQHSS